MDRKKPPLSGERSSLASSPFLLYLLSYVFAQNRLHTTNKRKKSIKRKDSGSNFQRVTGPAPKLSESCKKECESTEL